MGILVVIETGQQRVEVPIYNIARRAPPAEWIVKGVSAQIVLSRHSGP